MKSYFSRFLHHTLSHSDVKHQSTSMLSSSNLTRISRLNKFATWFDLDTPIKSECDSLCAGRSMVEMLGVLAIIGVLSVGAIAGYSKAMFKYKLNKHTESFSILINEAIKLLPDLERHYGTNITSENNLSNFFFHANLLPDGMSYKNAGIYDIFNNRMDINYTKRGSGVAGYEYYMHIRINRSGNNITAHDKEICRNIMLATKENYENIYYIQMRSGNGNSYSAKNLQGALNTNQTNPLNKATVTQIDDVCGSCNSETYCQMFLYFSIK